MIKWLKKAEKDEPEISGSGTQVVGVAVKTIAEMLGAYGKFSFRMEDVTPERIKTRFDDWSRHLLEGSQIEESSKSSSGRDWVGASKAFLEHRRAEANYVVTNFNDLRILIWTFSRLLGRELSEEKIDQQVVTDQLEKLRVAAAGPSEKSLKDAANDTVKVLGDLALKRKERHANHLNELGQKLRILQSELDRAKHEMQIDPMTRLYNRAALESQLERVVEISLYTGKPATLMMLDIDFFKKINDTYGHQGGDAVLKDVASVIIDNFPRKTDFVARYGGEEFTVLLQEADINVAKNLAEKLCETIRKKSFTHAGRDIPVTISIGVAEFGPGETGEAWMKRADVALYAAKTEGRDRVVVS